ncbi:MAG TPA: DinB family protein [Longimicrobiales bacterium]|nr:DinB family protein [Longimicrobiales bacterium]
MTGRDLLVQQFAAIYSVIARNIDGLTHADSLAPGAGGGNTANWILGHLVNVHNAVMQLIGAPPVWESEQLERARFDHPIRNAADAIDWDTLVERFNASRDTCLAALAALSDESLAEKMPGPFGHDSTRAGVLAVLVVHQCYHAGQLGMARRAAGKKAAILAPGQATPI